MRMARSYAGFGLRALALAGLVGLLAGCVETGGESSSPRSTATVFPTPTGSPESAPPLRDAPKLGPENGERVFARLSGSTGASAAHVKLGQGETFVTWTCEGTGPISVEFSDGVGYGARCEDLQAMGSSRNSDMTMSGKEFDVTVQAEPGQQWQLLVTQKNT